MQNSCAKQIEKFGNKTLRSVFALALLSILLSLIIPINTFDSMTKIEERARFANKLSQISNNKMTYGYSPEQGFSCIAKDFIKANDFLFSVPKSMSISPAYIFPFKFELLELLLEIPQIKATLGKDDTISVFMLVFQLMILKKGPRNNIIRAIEQDNLTDYKNYFEPDPTIYQMFPEFVSSYYNYDGSDVEKFAKMEINFDRIKIIENIFSHIAKRFEELKHKMWARELRYTFKSFQNFQDYYSIIASRAFTLQLQDIAKLEDLKENDSKLTPLQKKNIAINKKFGANGISSMISFIDICNHRQPKTFNDRTNHDIIILIKKNSFSHHSGGNYRPGNEILNNYKNKGNSSDLSLNYGFA